jgi:hypothetical protein
MGRGTGFGAVDAGADDARDGEAEDDRDTGLHNLAEALAEFGED